MNDVHLWGYLKSNVYRSNPTATADLEANIVEAINRSEHAMLQRVMNSTIKTMHECLAVGGRLVRHRVGIKL